MASSPDDRSENLSGEGILGGLGKVSDVDAPVVKVEAKCLWFAFAEGE